MFIDVLVKITATGIEFQVTTTCSVGNMSCIHPLIGVVSSETSTVRLLTIPNQVATRESPNGMNNGTMPSTSTTSQFAVRNCSALLGLPDSFQVGGRKSLVTMFEPAPVSSKLAKVSKVLDQTPTHILTQYGGFRKNDATSCRPSSNSTFKEKGPVGVVAKFVFYQSLLILSEVRSLWRYMLLCPLPTGHVR